jgi:hypothetical protein
MRTVGCEVGFVPLTWSPWRRGRNERARKGVQQNTVSRREHHHFKMTAPVCNRVALRIEYNGSAFHGWERKPGLRTVQGTIEDTLADIADGAVRTVAASKTDAGAHAVGQVLHFDACKQLSGNRYVQGALMTDSSSEGAVRMATRAWIRSLTMSALFRVS